MKSIFKTFILSVLVFAQVHFAFAQTASILPPAKTTFVDQNGKPLTSGTVDFYIPTTTTRKTTWQDAAETVPNTNPVVLDGAGRGLILGSGSYRQVVKDRNGNLVWDQVTSSVGSGGGGGGGTQTGDGDLVGTIKPWAGLQAPNQYVFAYGQELNRTTFAVLFTAITSVQTIFCNSGSPTLTGFTDTTNFAIGAVVEVSCLVAGFSTIVSKSANTVTLADNSVISTSSAATVFPWGNGNHTTTFNVPDFRGLIPVGNNNMGGVASTNLTATYFGVADPNSIGGAGGSQSQVLITSNLPPYSPAGSVGIIDPGHSHTSNANSANNFSSTGGGDFRLPATSAATINSALTGITATFAGTAQGGTSVPFSIIPPSKTTNYIIKVTPDDNAATASGVTALGGMTGSIACGTGLLCTGNIISNTGSSASITVGSTVISGGSTTNILFNNAGVLGEYSLASNADFFAGTANKIVPASVLWQAETVTAFSGIITFDFNTFKNTAVTLTGDITIQTLSNVLAGKAGMITFIQDGSGSHTTVWNSIFKFSGGTTPTLTTTPGAVDILTYSCRSATFCAASLLTDVR